MFKLSGKKVGNETFKIKRNEIPAIIEQLEKDLKIRTVDPEWVNREKEKLLNNYQQQQYLADLKAQQILNSYKPSFSQNGKLSYVLWKGNSICELLQASGYKNCLEKGGCDNCPLTRHLNNQVFEILNGVDTPCGNSRGKVEGDTFRDRRVFTCGSHKIEVEFCVKVTE